jgi:hypothetical protein
MYATVQHNYLLKQYYNIKWGNMFRLTSSSHRIVTVWTGLVTTSRIKSWLRRNIMGILGAPSHQRDDAGTTWACLDVQRDTSLPSAAPLAFFTFVMLLAPVTNREPGGLTLAGYWSVLRHGMKSQIVAQYHVSHLQRHGVTPHGKVTSVYPP